MPTKVKKYIDVPELKGEGMWQEDVNNSFYKLSSQYQKPHGDTVETRNGS